MSEKLDLDLDSKKVLKSAADMSEAFKKLSADIDEALGKAAAKSIDDLEKKAETSSAKIKKYFSNLGKSLKEDLKSAFDVGSVLTGLKFADQLGEGVKSVFNLERAFDRLNTRLQLTGREYAAFKKNVGSAVAQTGQKLEDVFPGVESASKGGVKSPQELAAIGGALGKVRAATGESTEALADSVVEILKTQNKKVNAQSFNQTLDALQATRVSGSFKSAGDAGAAIQAISPYGKQMGLGTREMGALAATASKSGESGQKILQQLMQQASQPGGKERLNSIFGQDVFKNGKLDAGALGKIDTKKFGQFSPQIMEQATGLSGASGGDLERFVGAFKTGMDGFDKVVNGAEETAKQFGTATDSLGARIEEFREQAVNTGREVGESLSEAAHQLLKGNFSKAGEATMAAGKSAYENKGTIAATVATTLGASILMGEGLKGLKKKIPGGDLLGGLAGEAAAEAMGIQKVYVVNAAEMRGGGEGAMDKISKFGGMGGKIAGAAGVLGAGAAGYELGSQIAQIPAVDKAGTAVVDAIFKAISPSDDDLFKAAEAKFKKQKGGNAGPAGNTEGIADAVAKGAEKGIGKKAPVQYTNPSAVTGRGGGM